jgi:hypothetical protein
VTGNDDCTFYHHGTLSDGDRTITGVNFTIAGINEGNAPASKGGDNDSDAPANNGSKDGNEPTNEGSDNKDNNPANENGSKDKEDDPNNAEA